MDMMRRLKVACAEDPDPNGNYSDSDSNDSDATCPEDFDS
jgi:hypothetical protein